MDTIFDTFLSEHITKRKVLKEVSDMKGYITANGYMGLVEGRYILFASEEDYQEYLAQ